jgi:hypothetical protein
MAALTLLLPTAVRGDEGKPKGRPDPETLFKHLDKNNDGVITANETPDDAPPPLKALLAAADKKGDKKITKDEFLAAAKERREAMHREHHPMAGPPQHRGAPGPRPDGPKPEHKPFDLKALFGAFDKDKDGKLSLDEFTAGMKNLHEKMMARMGERRGPPPGACPVGPGPRPEGAPRAYRQRLGCPCCERGPMPPWHGPGRYWWGEEHWRSFGPPREWGEHHHHEHHGDGFKALEAKVNDLEAKLKALEAKQGSEKK